MLARRLTSEEWVKVSQGEIRQKAIPSLVQENPTLLQGSLDEQVQGFGVYDAWRGSRSQLG